MVVKSKIVLLICLFLASPSFAQQEVDATITGGELRPLSMALPNFLTKTELEKAASADIGSVVLQDLQSTALFYLIPTDKIIAQISSLDAPVVYEDWTPMAAELLVAGEIIQADTENLQARFRVYDVIAKKELGEQVTLTLPATQWRQLGHQIADKIYSNVTGEGAYFNSKMVYVAEKKGDQPYQAIAVADSDGENVQYVTDGSFAVMSPRFAANNLDVIYTSLKSGDPKVVYHDMTTGEERPLPSLDGFAFTPRISPDGSFALASVIDENGNTDIVRIDMETGVQSHLTEDVAIDTAPSMSPDGTQYVFESNRTGKQQLYVASTIGGEAQLITSGEGRYVTPTWSPQGDLIAFSKIVDEQSHIGVINIDGTGERLLTTAYIDEAPAWAPNGRALVFYRESEDLRGEPRLFSISLAGRNMMAVNTPEFARDPSWSGLIDLEN